MEIKNASCECVSKKDLDGVVKFYMALVPEHESLGKPVDVEVFVTKAMPEFEKIIGADNMSKLKRYFGIGCNARKVVFRKGEYERLIDSLRTIENARFYIDGFSELISLIAAKMGDAPEGMPEIVKAKIIRMYETIWGGYHFFAEDFIRLPENALVNGVYDKSRDVGPRFCQRMVTMANPEYVSKNKTKMFYPEEMFDLYDKLLVRYPNGDLLYEPITFQINSVMFDARKNGMTAISSKAKLLKEILRFAELQLTDDGSLVSVNKVYPAYRNFADVRKGLKLKVHEELGIFPIDFCARKSKIESMSLSTWYLIYKLFTACEFDDIPDGSEQIAAFANGGCVEIKIPTKKVGDGVMLGGYYEAERFKHVIDYYSNNQKMMSFSESDDTLVNSGKILGAIRYLVKTSHVGATKFDYDLDLAMKMYEADKNDAIIRYFLEDKSEDFLTEALGGKKHVEKDILGLESPEDAVYKFMEEVGCNLNPDDADTEVISKVFLENFGKEFKLYNAGEIEISQLKKKIGFQDEFKEMYFSLAHVDLAEIQETLMDVKSKTRSASKSSSKLLAEHKLVIALYKFIMDKVKENNGVTCGTPAKKVKGMKALRADILFEKAMAA